jgi:hypothetical protein
MRVLLKAVAVVCAFLVVAGFAFPSFAATVTKYTEVVIRNTVDEPVPTKPVGTTPVEVTGTPTVNAKQSGPYAVDINGTPTVNVGNTPSVKISNTAPIPVSGTMTVAQPTAFSETTGGVSDAATIVGDTYHVPAGKDLVVTYVNAETRTFGTGQKTLAIGMTNGGGTFDTGITLPFDLESDGGAFASETTQVVFRNAVVAYATQASTQSPQTFRLVLTWTGYLVDEPAAP